MKNAISKDVFQKIQQGEVKQKPKYLFLLKQWVVGLAAIISLFVGAAAFSIVLYVLIHEDWDIYRQLTDNICTFFFLILPYFWIIIFTLFAAIVAYNIRHTQDGYRYRLGYLLLMYLVFTAVIGFIFYLGGLGKTIENAFAMHVPMIEKLPGGRAQFLVHPEKGVIGGKIIDYANKQIILLTPKDTQWIIQIATSTHQRHILIRPNTRIRVIGRVTDDNMFIAEEIRPWFPNETPHERLSEILFHKKMKENMLPPRNN